MRFLVDECAGPGLAHWLSTQGHDVFSVFEHCRGASDDFILDKAFNEHWILITNDRDFGEMVYRERRPHRGVVFLRLHDDRKPAKISAIQNLLQRYAQRLAGRFVVVTEWSVRFAK